MALSAKIMATSAPFSNNRYQCQPLASISNTRPRFFNSPLFPSSTLGTFPSRSWTLPLAGTFPQRVATRLNATPEENERKEVEEIETTPEWGSIVGSAGIWLLWAALAVYAFQFAPNLTKYQDQYFLEKLINLRGDDGFEMNKVLVSVFNLMGIWPAIYAQILIPTSRNADGKPAVWPFTFFSFFIGAFALLPYFALWRGDYNPKLPSGPEKESLALKILDSKITAASTAVGALILLAYAAFAGDQSWAEYFQYFRASRFIHVMTLDFAILTFMAPFWLYNDMTVRNWDQKDKLGLLLLAVPLLGPLGYLLLRPTAPTKEDFEGR